MKDLKYSIFLDIYGKLLKENQYTVLDLYYNEDYSLFEIGEQLNITRQGVHESIKKGEENLDRFEEKLEFYKKSVETDKKLDKILALTDDAEITKLLNELKAGE